MKFNLFKRKPKKDPVEELEELQELDPQEPEEEAPEPTGDEPICTHCKMPIWGEQKIKTFQGNKFHVKPCWRAILKGAKKEVRGQC